MIVKTMKNSEPININYSNLIFSVFAQCFFKRRQNDQGTSEKTLSRRIPLLKFVKLWPIILSYSDIII